MNSISGRLTLRVLIVSAIIFALTCMVFIQRGSNMVRSEAIHRAHSELSNTIHQIDAILNSVEVAVENTAWMVHERKKNPDFMYEVTEKLLQNNKHISGSAVAFEPYYFASKGHYFSPYSYRDSNGEIQSKQLGTDTYDYHYMDWYQIPKLLNESYWSEPYYDDGGGEMIMTTYSKPLYDEAGKLYAVITADISLEGLTDLVENIKPFENSFNLMASRNASFLVHPNHDLILNETLFSSTFGMENEALKKMQHEVVSGQSGEVFGEKDGENLVVFYSPVATTRWTVAIVCPRSELYLGVKKLRDVLIIVGLISLLIMLVLSYNGIRLVVAPIEKFSEAAKKIAHGEFNTKLPTIKSKDELKGLHDSFEYLQESLVRYIDELKATTANKERIESELRIAREIQMDMIPKSFPGFPERNDIALTAKLIPAKEVGGDLYDFFINDDKLYFIIGDVSGKGIPASLVMAVTCRLFRSVSAHLNKPEDIIASLNNSLSEANETNMFCTAFLGVLDLKTGKLNYCNAGHNAPYVIAKDGSVCPLEVEPNLAMGLLAGFPYQGQEISLGCDWALYLYTDGVNEAENNEKEQFGEDRLLSLLKENAARTPDDLIESTLDGVHAHVQEANQSDDITVMCMKYCNMEKSIVLTNNLSEIGRLTAFIEEIGQEFSLAPDVVFNLTLVLEEAVVNIINYAYPKEEHERIFLSAKLQNGSIVLMLTDTGKEFDPTLAPEADVTLSAEDRQIGGLGIFLIRQIMNEVKYERLEGKNILTLEKKL